MPISDRVGATGPPGPFRVPGVGRGRTGAVMRRLRRWLHYAIPLLVLFGAVAVRATSPQIVEEAHLRVFDAYQRLRPRAYQPQPVAIIDIDNQSLEKIGQWPWPRTYLADLLVRAFNAGAATVAFDIVFAEPDRTSPANVLSVWPATPEIEELREMAGRLPDHDTMFADVIRQGPVVTGFVPSDQAGENEPAVKWGLATAGDDPLLFLKPYAGAVINLPAIEEAAKGNGSFAIEPDPDNIIRRVNMLFSYGGKIYPSLSAEALRVAQGASTYIIKSSGANLEHGPNRGEENHQRAEERQTHDSGGDLIHEPWDALMRERHQRKRQQRSEEDELRERERSH